VDRPVAKVRQASSATGPAQPISAARAAHGSSAVERTSRSSSITRQPYAPSWTKRPCERRLSEGPQGSVPVRRSRIRSQPSSGPARPSAFASVSRRCVFDPVRCFSANGTESRIQPPPSRTGCGTRSPSGPRRAVQ
jgi:hypothetical protein